MSDDRPRYCETEGCYREPATQAYWADESESGGLVHRWVCDPCFNAVEYGMGIPYGNWMRE